MDLARGRWDVVLDKFAGLGGGDAAGGHLVCEPEPVVVTGRQTGTPEVQDWGITV